MKPRLEQLLAHARSVLRVARLRPFDTSTPDGRSHERYRRIVLSTGASIVGRGISALVALLMIPIAIAYLGTEQYGLWATISSLTPWVMLFDLGLVSGLVIPISEAHGRNDRNAARGYFSTAFFSLTAVAALLALGLSIALPLVSWQRVFAVGSSVAPSIVTASVGVALVFVIITLPLGVVPQMYAGYQKAYVGTAFATLGSVVSLLALVAAVRLGGSLAAVVAAASCAGALAGLANLVYLLSREMPWLRPGLSHVSTRALRRLRATSLPLYLFQLGALLVNQSQQLVLARRAGLTVVAEYDLLFRLYVLTMSLILVSTQSFFPSFRESFERGEISWMRRTFWRMVRLRMSLAAAAAVALVAGGNLAFRLWLHQPQFQYSRSVWLLLGMFILVVVWQSSFGELLTALDRIWPQVAIALIQGMLTVVLTAVLGWRFGVAGALLAIMCPAALLSACLLPWLAQTYLAAERG